MKKRVLAIAFDGFEPRIVEPMLRAGRLPSLEKLRTRGSYSRLRTTSPAVTPVAFSTFATGRNPGAHGIFDFVRRNPRTYYPDFSLNTYERKNAYLPPKAVNLRRGEAFWDILTRAGIPSTILRCPCTFPPDNIRGRMLSGMGVPDLRGGLGTSTFYTSAANPETRESETAVEVRIEEGRVVRTRIVGPRNPKTRSDIEFPITVEIGPAEDSATVRSEGQPEALRLRRGEWSDWLHVKFKFGLLQSVRGMVRFYPARLAPVFELYASPVNFDPDAPMFPISHPPDYSRELKNALGDFYTTGMVEDHGGLNNGRFDESAYMQQCSEVLRERERMMVHELERFDEGFFFCMFDTPDRVQHMFWRFREPDHPANLGERNGNLAHVIEDHYAECDRVLGKALEYADEDTLVFLFSDHGFSSFQRGIHLNAWLYQKGLLALKGKPDPEAGDFFPNVDWSRTQAYALGLSGIYINREGREEKGIVGEAQADELKAAIAAGLTGLGDPLRQRIAVRSVLPREMVYAGSWAGESPDLIVNTAEGYRASWSTALGGVPEEVFEDNIKKWGGDHIVDPDLVPGVIATSRPFGKESPSLLDLAPTILTALGVPASPKMEGDRLLS